MTNPTTKRTFAEIRIKVLVPRAWTDAESDDFMPRLDAFDARIAAAARGFFGEDGDVQVEIEN